MQPSLLKIAFCLFPKVTFAYNHNISLNTFALNTYLSGLSAAADICLVLLPLLTTNTWRVAADLSEPAQISSCASQVLLLIHGVCWQCYDL